MKRFKKTSDLLYIMSRTCRISSTLILIKQIRTFLGRTSFDNVPTGTYEMVFLVYRQVPYLPYLCLPLSPSPSTKHINLKFRWEVVKGLQSNRSLLLLSRNVFLYKYLQIWILVDSTDSIWSTGTEFYYVFTEPVFSNSFYVFSQAVY